MRVSRITRALVRLGFPLCGWLSLALFMLAVSGLPIPTPFAKDLSRAFPCMFSQCGCRNADECWRSCCCHSAAERVAWADAHNVQPPQFLVQAANDCEAPAPTNCCASEAPCEAQGSDPSGHISLSAALKCRGAGDFLAGVQLCLPPARPDGQPSLSPLITLGPAVLPGISPEYAPAIPPPRDPIC